MSREEKEEESTPECLSDRVTQKLLADLTAANQERWVGTCARVSWLTGVVEGFQCRGFWSRLNWLVTGR